LCCGETTCASFPSACIGGGCGGGGAAAAAEDFEGSARRAATLPSQAPWRPAIPPVLPPPRARRYRRYEKRHKTVSAHASPAFLIKEGDVVTVGECRPLSKTVRFNVLKVEKATEAGAIRAKKTFRVF
jgi:ribosomal protein S30